MDSETNGKPSAGASDPHKTVEVFQKNRKLWQAAWGNGLKPAEFPDSKHAFVGKTPNEKKSREVFQNPILRPVAARLRSHSIACSLLPLAVLKPPKKNRCKKIFSSCNGSFFSTSYRANGIHVLFVFISIRVERVEYLQQSCEIHHSALVDADNINRTFLQSCAVIRMFP